MASRTALGKAFAPVLLLGMMVLLPALWGCLQKPVYTVGQWFNLQPNTIQKGVTGKAQVLAELGRPTLHLNTAGQTEVMVYSYSTGEEKKLDVGLLVITFDAAGLVRDYYVGFNSNLLEEKMPKQAAKADYISASSIQIIQDLLHAQDPNQKISAVLLSFEGFRPGLLGFLKSHLAEQVDAESDKTVQAVYLLALDGIEDEKHEQDSAHSDRLLTLLADHPEILTGLEKTNVVALSALKDFVEQKAGRCSRKAVSLVFRNLLTPEFGSYFLPSAKNLFAEKTECALEFFSSLDAGKLQKTINLMEIRKDIESKSYLKLQYYKAVSDPAYGGISDTVLRLIHES